MAETPFEAAQPNARSLQAARARSLALSWPVVLAVILIVGASLRFHGLDWDKAEGSETLQQMHPDERFLSLVADRLDWPDSVGGYFDTERSTLNPYNDGETNSYVYGTFPLFLAKAISTVMGDDETGKTHDSYDGTILWGRRLAAFFDTMTILAVFGAGWVLFGRRVGLVAAALYALAVLPTQLAHFWTVDPFLTFFGALALFEGALLVCTRSLGKSAWLYGTMGVTLGLAAACKVNGVLFISIPFVATALRYGVRDDTRLGLRWRGQPSSAIVPDDLPHARNAAFGNWMNDISLLCMTLAIGLVVFRIAQPYAFTGPNFWDTGISQRWWDDIQRELDNQKGNADNPPFFQWANRTPFLWPLQNLVLWGLGPTLGIAALVACIAGAIVMFRRREVTFLLPLTLAAVVFAFQGSRFTAYMRYFEPMYPALCPMAGWALVALWGFARAKGELAWQIPSRMSRIAPARLLDPRILRGAALCAIIAVAAGTAWWALAFQSIYGQEQSRLEASRWIIDNLPTNTAITGEYWDDTLPYPVPNPLDKRFKLVETAPYDPDSPEKVRQLVYGLSTPPGVNRGGGLEEADYVAISSNRIRDSVARLERKYPATIRYYELLESGELGFELVKTWDVHPTFLGISIDDSSAEESFTVYDHPEVRLYKKTDRWNAERAIALLSEARPEAATHLLPRQGRTNGLQYTRAEAAAQQSGGTFTDVFDEGHIFSHAPWAWWLLWLELAAFAAIPWVTWLFRVLPDQGYALTKLLGVVAVVLPTWLLVAWGAADFSGTLVWAVFAAALIVGAALAYLRRATLIPGLRERWATIAAVEAVFLLVFFAFLAIRAYNPDLWHHPQGGEKPMEIAYLTAVIRSTNLPPYDPWFAGGTMNYYYMGWFFLAVPVRALRIMPEIAFNLAIPTFAALAATTAFSTASNLVALSRRSVERPGDGVRLSAVGYRAPIAIGLLGAFLLVFIANLDPLHQTVERLQAVNEWAAFEGTPVIGGAAGILGGFWNWAFNGADLPPYDWWRSSRVHLGSFDITEFPYFSLLFADLHPHVMGLPFFGLAIALAVAYAANAHAGLRVQGWLLAIALGFALGLVRTVHTWDFPTSVILVTAGVVIGQIFAPGRWQQRFWDGTGHLAVAAGVLTIAFAPYTAHFEVFNSGVIRAPETTEPQQYVAQFGIFLLVALAFLAARYYEELDFRDGDPGRNVLLATVAGKWELLALVIFVSGFTAFTWRIDLTVVGLSAILVAYLGNLLWLEWQRREFDLGRLLATLAFMLAFAIAAGVDLITVKNDIERMNTVFKFGLQAWQLFALAAAFATWYVGRLLSTEHRVPGTGAPRSRYSVLGTRNLLRWSAGAVGLFLLASGSIYLISGTRARQDARFAALDPTLDGMAWMDANPVFVEDMGDPNPANDRALNLADDRPLIDWLRDNVEGSPVIVEAVGPLYHWTGRFSEYTGLPTVIGWDWHQTQQRWDYGAEVQERRADTDRFWRATDASFAAEYLRKYNVRYIVVGTEEVAMAPDGLRKFANMPGVVQVFDEGDYAIYRVDQSRLRAANVALSPSSPVAVSK